MKLIVSDDIHLTEIRPTDKDAFVQYLNDKDIYDQTLRLPFPYTSKDADDFLAIVAKATAEQGQPVHFAIRGADGALIGGCGFDDFQAGKSHRAEIGYWVAKPFWGRGIMTAVLERLCRHAFDAYGLVRITAHVFTTNPASARVLEKCGFVEEGFLRKHYMKNGGFLDSRLFARALRK